MVEWGKLNYHGAFMQHFPVLVLVGRPGCGKSEIVEFLRAHAPAERLRRFHVAEPDLLDDFPLLWTWFEEDHILANVLNQPRLHTDRQGYFKREYLWDLLIERLSLEYHKRLRDHMDYHQRYTTIIEFARGAEHGGYAQAFPHLADDLLENASVLYVRVSYAESMRKNRLRFNPERPDSLLEHSLPDDKLQRLYKDDDWERFSAPNAEYITIRNHRVPYVILENEDDLTSAPGEPLAQRLGFVLDHLWDLRARL
jgi:hypothetical protein